MDHLIFRQGAYHHYLGVVLARDASDFHGDWYQLLSIGVRMLFTWMLDRTSGCASPWGYLATNLVVLYTARYLTVIYGQCPVFHLY